MTADDFTRPLAGLVAQARADAAGRQFSDIADAEGHQYVDLVMGGGGVLGIALVGYTYLLEEVGVRFLNIGGTSAGSINALTLAALGPPQEAKSRKLVQELASLDLWSLMDGPSGCKELTRAFAMGGVWRYIWGSIGSGLRVRSRLGLHPGDAFTAWLTGVLKRAGVSTVDQLLARMRAAPDGLRRRTTGEPLSADDVELALVACDVSTETKAIFPRMAKLYWPEPGALNPALFARASMAVPLLFEPLRVRGIPKGEGAAEAWRTIAHYDGPFPEECAFVDGGVMSNFPIDLFHKPWKVPAAPTFGVKLGTDQRLTRQFTRFRTLVGATFNSARHGLDYDFLARNAEYKQLVGCVDTGAHGWLNFAATDADRIDLFRRGAEAAASFLRGFDWEQYKETRRGVARTFAAAGSPASAVGDGLDDAARR